MKNKPSSAISYQIVLVLVLVVMISAIGGLGLVWLRQQITDTATRISALQREGIDAQRRLEYLDAKIAEVHRPDVLRQRAIDLRLALTRPQRDQVVHMGPLVLPAGPEGLSEDPRERGRSGDPYRNTFDLAVMEPLRAR